MATSSESNVKAHLLPPPSYIEATRHPSEINEHSRLPVHVGNPIPSVPVTTYVERVQPSTTTHRDRLIIITAIIVCGLVTIALIVSLTIIFLQHKIIIATATVATTTTTTLTTTTKRPICFDGDAHLTRADGSQLKIRDVKIGDQILVAYGVATNNVQLRSSPVLAVDIFQKYNNASPVNFLEIHVESNGSPKPLHITPRHSLFVRKKDDSQAKYLFASQVQVGDYVYLRDDDYFSAWSVQVIGIAMVELPDAYAPLTLEGTLVVNNIIVSCYGTFTHSLAHLLMTPRRWLLYGAFQAASVLIGSIFMGKKFDLSNNYFIALDLFPLSVRTRFRDWVDLFQNNFQY